MSKSQTSTLASLLASRTGVAPRSAAGYTARVAAAIAQPIVVPVRTRNPLNSRADWRVTAAVSRRARTAAYLSCLGRIPLVRPAVVTLTRLSCGEMDDDNLAATLKPIRDGVADVFGSDDSSRSGLRFDYRQEKCKRGEFGVRVDVRPVPRPNHDEPLSAAGTAALMNVLDPSHPAGKSDRPARAALRRQKGGAS